MVLQPGENTRVFASHQGIQSVKPKLTVDRRTRWITGYRPIPFTRKGQ